MLEENDAVTDAPIGANIFVSVEMSRSKWVVELAPNSTGHLGITMEA